MAQHLKIGISAADAATHDAGVRATVEMLLADTRAADGRNAGGACAWTVSP